MALRLPNLGSWLSPSGAGRGLGLWVAQGTFRGGLGKPLAPVSPLPIRQREGN